LETFVDGRQHFVEIEPSYNELMDFEQVVLEMPVVAASYQDENEVMKQHHYY
jgi:kynurenine formamidase